jgi:putative Ca2+/H+ antiporter (TMEM165/GDT1 family)
VAALIATFVASILAEIGDKTMWFAVALALRYGKSWQIPAGALIGIAANALIAAFAGSLLHGRITLDALSLLVAVALGYAGIAGLLAPERPAAPAARDPGPFLAAAGGFFLLEFGDKTQFLTASLAARYDAFLLAAGGATAGVLLTTFVALGGGEQLRDRLSVRPVRGAIGLAFLLAGCFVAVAALGLG